MDKFNALVAEKVMGFVYKLGNRVGGSRGPQECYGWGQPGFPWVNPEGLADYSGDITAFDAVKRNIEKRGWVWQASNTGEIMIKFWVDNWDIGETSVWSAETEPMAGCLATLRAVGVTEETIQEALNE